MQQKHTGTTNSQRDVGGKRKGFCRQERELVTKRRWGPVGSLAKVEIVYDHFLF